MPDADSVINRLHGIIGNQSHKPGVLWDRNFSYFSYFGVCVAYVNRVVIVFIAAQCCQHVSKAGAEDVVCFLNSKGEEVMQGRFV